MSTALADRMAGDYSPPILVEPIGGPIPHWSLFDEPTAANRLRILGIDVSQIDLSHVQQEWERALDGLLAHWVSVSADMRTEIVDQVRRAVNRDDLKALAKLAPTQAAAVTLIRAALDDMAAVAAQQVVDDAAEQQVNLEPEPGPPLQRQALATVMSAILASAMSVSAAREAVRRYHSGASGTEVANAVDAHLAGLSDAFPRDVLGGGLTAAQNGARIATMMAGPEAAIYASEMMDKRTCPRCVAINGKWLGNSSDMTQVYEIYPNGGYVDCLGGSRCRGTIVSVYRPEQTPAAGGMMSPTALLDRTYKRDKDGKFSSGSGGGVREALDSSQSGRLASAASYRLSERSPSRRLATCRSVCYGFSGCRVYDRRHAGRRGHPGAVVPDRGACG